MARPQAAVVTPVYWDDACKHLARRDRVMKKLIPQFGEARLQSRGDAFTTLARSIVGQQISVKAAQSVWSRLEARAKEVTPERIARMRAPTLRSCGLSDRKVEYVRDLARHFRDGVVDPGQWARLDDEAIIDQLTQVRGVGRWTAEMFLIFNLLRPDVLPLDDLGVLRAVAQHYGGNDAATLSFTGAQGRALRTAVSEVGERWRPWRTVATWYLWRSLDPVPVEY
jgi:DNA-3-methyladenine glycosylase II